MKQSVLPTKVRKEIPKEEAKNAKLLIQSGFIHKTIAGVYNFLPFGLKSLNKIIAIIKEEMESVGAVEVLMSSIQNKDIWEKTKRWSGDTEDVWLKTKIQSDAEVGLGWTNEEPIAEMFSHHINSYKDLPFSAYQVQTKFRNEKRAKSGLLRTREFIMKDLYTFSINEKQHKIIYEKIADAYVNVFNRVGIGDRTYRTYASGGAFTKFSDEFQTTLDIGEDVIYINKKKNIAINKEIFNDETLKELNLSKSDFKEESNSVEVGNIFTLGKRFSEPLGFVVKTDDGKEVPVFMGSYGIGPARLLGAIVEIFSKEKNIILPASVSPFSLHLISLGSNKEADTLYKELSSKGLDVLYDDRDLSAGEKFAESDLIGIPHRIIISKKSLENNEVEYKDRIKDKIKMIKNDTKEILKLF